MSGLTRREMLVGSAALAAGAACSAVAGQENVKPVGWAILGLGGYAQNQILPNMKSCQLSTLKAFISGSPEKAKRLAGQYGLPDRSIYTYESLEKIAEDPEIEVVYVITPPGTHHDFTVRSLRAGKHVCCEKPMAGSAAECESMVKEAKKAGKRLQIGYRCHFEPYNLEAMRLCREGELGDLRTIRSEHGFVLGWDGGWHTSRKLGGFGAISEIGVYAIQALCYLAGADPVEIIGTRTKLNIPRFKEVEDVNHFNLIFPNGVQGMGSTAYSWNANNFVAMGTKGRLTAEPATGYGGHRFALNGRPLTVEAGNQWARQMDHLSECVRDPQKTLIAPGEMGWRDIKIIEAILKSAEDKKVIRFQ
jgi:predicted dehydrogenase